MRRKHRIAATALVAALLAYGALDVVASRLVARRLARAVASSDAIRGSMAGVDVCPACASYRVRDLVLHPAEGVESSSLLLVDTADVGLAFGSVLEAHPTGGVTLKGAELHLPVGRVEQDESTALDVPWREVGAALLPIPVDRVGVRDGVLVVRHRGFREPIVWRFAEVSVDALHLSGAAASPAEVRATGKTPGGGHFELQVELASGGAQRFTLAGALHDVPLAALGDYLEQVLGLGVEGGRLDARFDIEGTRRGWRGHVDCRIEGLDVFDPSDLAAGPARALWDAVAGAVSSVAEFRRGGPLQVRLEVQQRLGEPRVDVWRVLARLVREAVLAPFARPLEVLRRAAVGSGADGGG